MYKNKFKKRNNPQKGLNTIDENATIKIPVSDRVTKTPALNPPEKTMFIFNFCFLSVFHQLTKLTIRSNHSLEVRRIIYRLHKSRRNDFYHNTA